MSTEENQKQSPPSDEKSSVETEASSASSTQDDSKQESQEGEAAATEAQADSPQAKSEAKETQNDSVSKCQSGYLENLRRFGGGEFLENPASICPG